MRQNHNKIVCIKLVHLPYFIIVFYISFISIQAQMRSYYSHPLKMGAIGCPETSVRNYQYSLRNSPAKA